MNSSFIKRIILSSKIGETIASDCLSFHDPAVRSEGMQRRETWGNEFEDKTFFVVSRPNNWGLGSIAVMYTKYFEYALRRGWIPVVDMENAHTIYLENGKLGCGINAWEWFFEQPCGYSLSDIKNAKNIVVAPYHLVSKINSLIDFSTITSKEELDYWRSISTKYLRLSNDAKKYISILEGEEQYKKFLSSNVLGVYCRGTDYLDAKPKGHPVQPDPRDVVNKAKELMYKLNPGYIFLVTEDERILSLFLKEFPNKVIYIPGQRYGKFDSSKKWIWQQDKMKNRDGFLNGMEYLASMYYLSKCDYIIGGITGGLAGSLLLNNNNFKYRYFWNLGRY